MDESSSSSSLMSVSSNSTTQQPRVGVSYHKWSILAPSFVTARNHGPGVEIAHAILSDILPMCPFTDDSVFLDIGSGPGQVIYAFRGCSFTIPSSASARGWQTLRSTAPMSTSVSIIATDNDLVMLEIISSCIAWERVRPVFADAHFLTRYATESITHAVGSLVYPLLPRPRQALRAAYRVLKPGGIFAMSSMIRAEWLEELRLDKHISYPESRWRNTETVRRELEGVGFIEVRVNEVAADWHFATYDEVESYLVSALTMLMEDVPTQMVRNIITLTMEWLKEKYPTVPATMPGKALIARGRKSFDRELLLSQGVPF